MPFAAGTNSYVTLNEAAAYLELSVRAAGWVDLETASKERALVSAWRMLNRLTFNTATAALLPATPPTALKDAQCELAWELSQDPTLETAQTMGGGNIKRVQGGPASVEYFKSVQGQRFPVPVVELLAPLLESASSGDVNSSPMGGGYLNGGDPANLEDGEMNSSFLPGRWGVNSPF